MYAGVISSHLVLLYATTTTTTIIFIIITIIIIIVVILWNFSALSQCLVKNFKWVSSITEHVFMFFYWYKRCIQILKIQCKNDWSCSTVYIQLLKLHRFTFLLYCFIIYITIRLPDRLHVMNKVIFHNLYEPAKYTGLKQP